MMKIRKGKRKYAVFINKYTEVCTLTKVDSWYDIKWFGKIPSFECTFREAVKNLRACKEKNYYITKRRR